MSDHGVLELSGVEKTFSGHLSMSRTRVVKGIDLTVGPGEIFGFLGSNGAGKTTTIKMIVGLIFPSKGEIRVLGRASREPGARACLGYLPENPYFYDYLTGKEFLTYYGQLYGLSGSDLRGRVQQKLERVGMASAADVPLRKYSKGMVQRIGVAQVLLNDPRLVVLDEPMSGLDPVGRREIRDILLELKRSGTTVFFSSHILQDAEMICDRVGILSEGRLVREGRLKDLLEGRSGYEVTVTGLPEAIHEELEAQSSSMVATADGRIYRLSGDTDLSRFIRLVLDGGGVPTQVTPQRRTLEELFLVSGGSSGNGND